MFAVMSLEGMQCHMLQSPLPMATHCTRGSGSGHTMAGGDAFLLDGNKPASKKSEGDTRDTGL